MGRGGRQGPRFWLSPAFGLILQGSLERSPVSGLPKPQAAELGFHSPCRAPVSAIQGGLGSFRGRRVFDV